VYVQERERERDQTSEHCLSSSLITIASETPSWFKKSANGIYKNIKKLIMYQA